MGAGWHKGWGRLALMAKPMVSYKNLHRVAEIYMQYHGKLFKSTGDEILVFSTFRFSFIHGMGGVRKTTD